MTRVPLLSRPYESRSLIASAQKCINLFPEENKDTQAPVPITHYTRAGLNVFAQGAPVRTVRQSYRSTAGKLYCVIGTNVYYVDDAGVFNLLGTITDANTTVYFQDNGLVIVLVDGTATNGQTGHTPLRPHKVIQAARDDKRMTALVRKAVCEPPRAAPSWQGFRQGA